jgi:hypothetical protein
VRGLTGIAGFENPFKYWFPKFSEAFGQLQEKPVKCPFTIALLRFVFIFSGLLRGKLYGNNDSKAAVKLDGRIWGNF